MVLRPPFFSWKQHSLRVNILRCLSGSTKSLPSTSVTEVNRNVTLEQHTTPTDMPRPLVILLGWMFAKPAHLKKFSNIYVEQGFDVITVRIRPGQLLLPSKVKTVIRGVMDMCQDGDRKYQPLMSHGFSVGGYMYGELLVSLLDFPDKYSSIADRLCAQVFDSPIDFEGIPKGLSRAASDNIKMRASLQKGLEWYLSTFKGAMREYVRASEAFRANDLRLPSIFFYSLSDPVCDPEHIERVALSWSERGLEATTVFWERAPHVCTYKKYPDEYKHSLLQFIWRSGIKGHNPRSSVCPEDAVPVGLCSN